jgi:hypothetical protein
MLGGMVNRHATMMAYNNVFWMMGMPSSWDYRF